MCPYEKFIRNPTKNGDRKEKNEKIVMMPPIPRHKYLYGVAKTADKSGTRSKSRGDRVTTSTTVWKLTSRTAMRPTDQLISRIVRRFAPAEQLGCRYGPPQTQPIQSSSFKLLLCLVHLLDRCNQLMRVHEHLIKLRLKIFAISRIRELDGRSKIEINFPAISQLIPQ